MNIINKSKLINFLFIMISIISITSCSPPNKKDNFDKLYRASKSLQGAISIGVNYSIYTELLQKYATELLILRNINKTAEELKLFYLYQDALTIFIDAQKIWKIKIESPKYKWIPENNIFPLVGLTDIISQYQISIMPIKDKSGKTWQTISSESVQLLWSKANLKIAEADKLIAQKPPPPDFFQNLWYKIIPEHK